MTRANKLPLPSQRLVPYLTVKGAADALAFYVRAFGAVETMRIADPSGVVGHAELTIDGVQIMLSDEFPDYDCLSPQTLGGSSSSLTLYVDDVDAAAQRAVHAGATLTRPIKDEFYGERVARLKDPFGHKWALHTRLEQLSNEEVERRAQQGGGAAQ